MLYLVYMGLMRLTEGGSLMKHRFCKASLRSAWPQYDDFKMGAPKQQKEPFSNDCFL